MAWREGLDELGLADGSGLQATEGAA
jgi:hypothetical protein